MNAQVTVLAKYEYICRHWGVDVKLWESAAILIFIMCSAVDNLAEPGTESSIRWGLWSLFVWRKGLETVQDQ